MKTRKLNKKRIILALGILIALIATIILTIYLLTKKEPVTPIVEEKVVDEIKDFDYSLSDNKSELYKTYFQELKTELTKDEIDEENYAKILSKLFIADFYDLNSKASKNDVGGATLVYSEGRDNFLLKAKDTIYKYVENNIYGDRKQELPEVSSVGITNISKEKYEYNESVDEESYAISLEWEYEKDLGYQTKATLYLIHTDKKLFIAELKELGN